MLQQFILKQIIFEKNSFSVIQSKSKHITLSHLRNLALTVSTYYCHHTVAAVPSSSSSGQQFILQHTESLFFI